MQIKNLVQPDIFKRASEDCVILDNLINESQEILLNLDNIYRVIMHQNEMPVCTVDYLGLIQIHMYEFKSGNLKKWQMQIQSLRILMMTISFAVQMKDLIFRKSLAVKLEKLFQYATCR